MYLYSALLRLLKVESGRWKRTFSLNFVHEYVIVFTVKWRDFITIQYVLCRASEGKTVEVPYRGDVNDTVRDVLGGLRNNAL